MTSYRRQIHRLETATTQANSLRSLVKRLSVILSVVVSLGGSLSASAKIRLFDNEESKGAEGANLNGVYYVAYRTPAHVARSSPDVFHGVANDMLDLLKTNDVNVVADPERGTIETNELFSVDSLLSLTKNAGATSLLYLTVDRPATSWLRLTLQCYDLSGKLLWEEHASSSGGLSGRGAPSKSMENLKKKLLPRIGQPGLPKIKKPAQAAEVVQTGATSSREIFHA